jgi:hypothetical protein
MSICLALPLHRSEGEKVSTGKIKIKKKLGKKPILLQLVRRRRKKYGKKKKSGWCVCRPSGRRKEKKKEKKKEKWREDKRVEVSVKIEREVMMDVSKKKKKNC